MFKLIKNKIALLLLLILVTPSMLHATAPPLLREYSIEGISIVVEGNKDLAKKEAIEDAFRNSVRLAARVILRRDPSAKERVKMEEMIVNNSKKYIEGYSVIQESIDEESCNLTLSVSIFQGYLNKDLDKLGLKPLTSEAPLVITLIEEKILPVYNRDNFMSLFSISEKTIVDSLYAKGWNIVGRKKTTTLSSNKLISRGIDGDIDSLISLGEKLDAAVVVAGKVSIDSASGTESRLEVRVVSVGSQRLLGENTFKGKSTSSDPLLAKTEAIKNAAKDATRFVEVLLKREIGLTNRENRQPITIPVGSR